MKQCLRSGECGSAFLCRCPDCVLNFFMTVTICPSFPSTAIELRFYSEWGWGEWVGGLCQVGLCIIVKRSGLVHIVYVVCWCIEFNQFIFLI